MLEDTTWKYEHNGKVITFREGGQVVGEETGDVVAKWQVLNSRVTVRQTQGTWEDTMVLSPDGVVLAGTNHKGKPVRATRVNGK